MSLNWSLVQIKGYETLCWIPEEGKSRTQRLAPVTETLIFLTMPVGIGQITERNAGEFYARVHAWERVTMARRMNRDGETVFITPEQVFAHVGLSTNASSMTKIGFAKNLFKRLEMDAKEKWDKRITVTWRHECDAGASS
jgi:hypothetical protein